MAKGTSTEKPKTALLVLNGTSALITDKRELAQFQDRTAKQIAIIFKTENENVLRRIFVGLALWRIKASLRHGEFGPWLKKHVNAGHSHVNHMMRAARVFVENARIAQPDVLRLADGELAVEVRGRDAETRKLVSAATKFVGDLSWGELLETYGIRDAGKVGGARTAAKDASPDTPNEEQLYLFARDEIGGLLNQAETLLVKENRLQFLAKHPEEVRGVVESLRTLADKVEAAAKPLLTAAPKA
ncbi:DUF3102 domain-containing protein [Opitutus sp. ER46]|uniref:DUF3102 domain-containing protein n=1 Tax=Opitutus sp. ER46 TaxID=2161864 RepID=UPI000D31BF6C|nr:DUF3102 domain-containing protein [Opitutus sp. ER46]PTX95747.1 hypothetical protein DB354_10070 [Opitutus sp. ER46]